MLADFFISGELRRSDRHMRRTGRPKGSKSNPNRTPIRFKQSEIERAIKSVRSMGLQITSVVINPTTGEITVTSGASPPLTGDGKTNPWDEATHAKNEKRVA
jgi:hypothetical protein